jgi:hypothetical protein
MYRLKKILCLLAFTCLVSLQLSIAQGSDRIMLDINKLYILPVISFCNNQVTLVAEVTTRSNGIHLGYEISREKNAIFIEDCFYVGMLTVINNFKVTIPLGYLKPGEYYVKYTACPSLSNEKCIRDPLYCVSKELKFKVGGNYILNFKKGWNIASLGCWPLSGNSKEIFKPLIENGSLIKVQDETGNALEDYGIFNPDGGWFSTIDTIHPSKGYKVKVNNDCALYVCGIPVDYPFKIPMRQGWNLVSFPCQGEADGFMIVKELLDRGTLVKVQDEAGNSVENFGVFGGWMNNIGNFKSGEGYKIKLIKDDTLTIYESFFIPGINTP